MKRLFSFSICAIILALFAEASTTWVLRGNTYNVDTLFHTYVGPGTTQTSLSVTGNSKLKVFYTTTDLKNPYVDVKVVMGNDKVVGVETVSSMAQRKSVNGTTYFAGVNADFFGNSAPIGSTMVNGEVYNINNSGWPTFGITDTKIPHLGTSNINARIVKSNGASQVISGFNTARYENNIILYSNRNGSTTATNIYGAEVLLTPVVAGEYPNTAKKVQMRVTGTPVDGVGSMTIPAGGFVLSGNGSGATYVKTLANNEIIDIEMNVNFNMAPAGNITQVVGGQPMILSNGNVLDTDGVIDHLVGLHPRTAVGYNSDKTKLVMLVVDGRSTESVGVTSKALADIMFNIGCTEAMNFDGGGSTDLYIDKLGVINTPSDGRERAVTNGLFLSTSTPTDNTIASIRFNDQSKSLPKYGYYTPKFYGYNQYGVLVSTDVKGVTLSAPTALGEIQNNGTTLFCTGEGCHALTAHYQSATTTMPITISKGNVSFRLPEAIVDGFEGYSVEVISTINGESLPLDNQALTWSSDDNSIATVEPFTGIVHGIKNGETIIRGSVDDFAGEIKIIVQKPTDNVMPLDPNMDLSTWAIAQSGGSGLVSSVLENGVKLEYIGASSRAPYIRLSKKINIWSVPDGIILRINPGEASIKKITFALNTPLLGNVNASISDLNLTPNAENVIKLPNSDWCNANDRGNYPILFNNVYFEMGSNTTGQNYTIQIPGIEASYIQVPASVDGVIGNNLTAKIYPNPVKSGETARIEIANADKVNISIVNLSGALVKSFSSEVNNGIVELSTEALQSGVYLINILTTDNHNTLKLIIK